MTLSEEFATMFDTPVNFIASVCLGGAVGYLTGHYILGGNRELVVLKKMSNAEKQALLMGYIEASRSPSSPDEVKYP